MVNVVKLSDARKKREKEEFTKRDYLTLEWLYQRKLTANEKTIFEGLSKDDQINEILDRSCIAYKAGILIEKTKEPSEDIDE